MTHAGEVQKLVDHLFRHEAGRMVATLTRIFGPEHLELAEDVVQDALLKALRHWPYHGVPANPRAWLTQVAKHRALDHLRRQAALRDREAELKRWAESRAADADPDPAVADDSLRLMFLCCHESLSAESRIALTLKTLGGFGVVEIARAFLTPEATVAQRLVRAKRKLKESGVAFAIPEAADLAHRLDSVLDVLYLMFNEGYAAHSGDRLVREDLVYEAIRLTRLLLDLPPTRAPEVHALLALMLFQAARLPARVDDAGDLLLLAEQDRSRWNRSLIAQGFTHLAQAGKGNALTAFHLEAGIASCHARSGSWADTDWGQILTYYDWLVKLNPSPVVALNRAVALAQVAGPEPALAELDKIRDHPQLQDYCLLPATLGELHRLRGEHAHAAACFRRALALAGSAPERRFLLERLRACNRDAQEVEGAS
jgi:RNA polymerase sigma-70 factor (ECF subfamily)